MWDIRRYLKIDGRRFANLVKQSGVPRRPSTMLTDTEAKKLIFLWASQSKRALGNGATRKALAGKARTSPQDE